MPNYYEILDVNPQASTEEIKTAYKIKAQILHPDKGGHIEEFKILSEAYQVLSNDKRRVRYDRGEDVTKPEVSLDQKATHTLASIFDAFISNNPGSEQDIIQLAKIDLNNRLEKIENDLNQGAEILENMNALLKRITYKGEGLNLFSSTLNAKVGHINLQIEKLLEGKEVVNRSIELLDDYDCKIVNIAPTGYIHTTTSTTGF